jgi:hypothetical protein
MIFPGGIQALVSVYTVKVSIHRGIHRSIHKGIHRDIHRGIHRGIHWGIHWGIYWVHIQHIWGIVYGVSRIE